MKKHTLTDEQLQQLGMSASLSVLRIYTLLKAATEDIAYLKEYGFCLHKSILTPLKQGSKDIDYLITILEKRFALKSGLSESELSEHKGESFNLMDFIESELVPKTNAALNKHLNIVKIEEK